MSASQAAHTLLPKPCSLYGITMASFAKAPPTALCIHQVPTTSQLPTGSSQTPWSK